MGHGLFPGPVALSMPVFFSGQRFVPFSSVLVSSSGRGPTFHVRATQTLNSSNNLQEAASAEPEPGFPEVPAKGVL